MMLLLFLFPLVVFSQSSNCSCSTPLTVASYNILQIPFAPFRAERFTLLLQYLQNTTFDVLCLQELFDPDQRDALVSALSSIYPYMVAPGNPATDSCTMPCTDDDLTTILECLDGQQCLLASNTAALGCLATNCESKLQNISSTCSDCVFGTTSGLGLTDKMQSCAGQNLVTVNLDGNLVKAYNACDYLFDGESDTLILSQHPILKSDILRYDISPFFFNTALYANIQVSGFSDVHVFCTHMAANIPFTDNENANLEQIEDLMQWISSKVPTGNGTVIVAGDFNMSPVNSKGSIEGSFSDSFWKMDKNYVDASFLYANITSTGLQCTYCADNDLTSFDFNSQNIQIDHVFARNDADICVSNWQRFSTGTPLTVPGFLGQSGTKDISISDHFGIEASFCPNGNVPISQLAAPFRSIGSTPSSASSFSFGVALFISMLFWIVRY